MIGKKKEKRKGISLPPDLEDEERGEIVLSVHSLNLSAFPLSQKRAIVRVKWYVLHSKFVVCLCLLKGGESKGMVVYLSIMYN